MLCTLRTKLKYQYVNVGDRTGKGKGKGKDDRSLMSLHCAEMKMGLVVLSSWWNCKAL
eukprot:m.226772 g.226772  ORF g.226772 m.226772 type:complete len:58 (+) comp33501_c7_seq2:126-299(+)